MKLPIALFAAVSLAAPYAQAINRAFTLQGNSESGGQEWVTDCVLGNYCLRKSGWETRMVSSDQSSPGGPPDAVKPLVDKVLPGAVVQLSAGESTEAQYIAALRDQLKDLHSGDQFLLRISAHGQACEPKGEEANEHCFMVLVPPKQTPEKVHTKKLLEALKEAKKNGVKIAVDLDSCHSGLAIQPFSEAGICAHAVATGDAPGISCGGEDHDPSDTGDATTAFYCKDHAADARALELGSTLKTKDQVDCFNGALNHVAKLDLPPHVTEEQLFDRLRSADTSPNQSVSSAGPYWIFGLLSDFGQAVIDGGKRGNPTCTAAATGTSDVVKTLARQVDEISQQAAGCALSKLLLPILQAHREELQQYVQLANKAKIVPATQDQQMKDLAGKGSILATSADPSVAGQARGLLQVLDAADTPASERAETAQQLAKLSGGEQYIRPLGELATKQISDSREAEKNLRIFVNAHMIPMERKLYHAADQSDCVRNDPKLHDAQQGCHDFTF